MARAWHHLGVKFDALTRPGILVGALLACVLAVLAVVADRSLVSHERAERATRDAEALEEASRAGLALRAALGSVEQAALEGRASAADVAWSVATPPIPRIPGATAKGYAQIPRASLALLLGSHDSTGSGLPEAALAAIALGDADARARVARALLAGELPVAAGDVSAVAAALGADPAAAATLERRLGQLPPRKLLPEFPAFRREIEGSRVKGWSRGGRRVVHYEVEVRSLLAAAGLEGRVSRDAGTGLPLDVPDLEGLALSFNPTPPALRPRLMRVLLWAAVLTCGAAVIALSRSLEHQRRLISRERQFLATVTHELRTPVAAVRLFGETLAQGRGNSREYGQMIADESQRLEALSERVLTAARLESEPRLADCDPLAVIEDALAPIRPRATQLGKGLVESLGPLPRACWDALAVCHAVRNLLDNALRHGATNVTVEAHEADGTLRIAVSDDGPGISRRDRSRIFERFERGPTQGTGVGLGLWLVDRVARAHGGSVDLESEPGFGARFTLLLPLQPIAPRGRREAER